MKAFRNRVKTTVLALVMVACMVASVLAGFGTVEAKADLPQTPVQYADYNQATGEFTTKSCNAYVEVSSESDLPGLTMGNGNWYVFKTTVEITNRITVSGTANIILMDGCVFTASGGINVPQNKSLYIYGQGTINGENSTPGELIATGGNGKAGIGDNSGSGGHSGNIIINGGIVRATGGNRGAGIGGGSGRHGRVTINGGKVIAIGGNYASGIGGGGYISLSPSPENETIVTINGGQIYAVGGSDGAGIGNGWGSATIGTIKIYGGMIEAVGGIGDRTGDGIGKGAYAQDWNVNYNLGSGRGCGQNPGHFDT